MRFSKPVLAVALATLAVAAPQPAEEKRDIIGDLSSIGNVIAGGFTSIGAGIFRGVTSLGGEAYTVITSEGGQAITLAGSAGGVATSFAGSVYTVATGNLASLATNNIPSNTARPSNAAVGPISPLSMPLMVGFATVVGGAIVGASMVM